MNALVNDKVVSCDKKSKQCLRLKDLKQQSLILLMLCSSETQ
ncbi:hypothetical protein VPHK435_0030 [Vibrio phage K435]